MEHLDDGNELLQTLYEELRKLAHARLRRLEPGQTLQTTALVHEAYLRLMRNGDERWNGKRHFFGAAAMAMRDILVESVRRKAALMRGGDHVRVDVPLSLVASASPLGPDELMSLHQALEAMQAVYPEHAEVVSLHCFAGLPLAEVSEIMAIPKRTIERRWRFARAWLHAHMTGEPEHPGADMI
jgi:RNA polymerase sigma factor (TIGR02999 family)